MNAEEAQRNDTRATGESQRNDTQATGDSKPADAATPPATDAPKAPLLEARAVSKYFGSVNALEDVTLKFSAGEVACVLGDNGAGKSTLIKILSGVHEHDTGSYPVEGAEGRFSSPREALDHG